MTGSLYQALKLLHVAGSGRAGRTRSGALAQFRRPGLIWNPLDQPARCAAAWLRGLVRLHGAHVVWNAQRHAAVGGAPWAFARRRVGYFAGLLSGAGLVGSSPGKLEHAFWQFQGQIGEGWRWNFL